MYLDFTDTLYALSFALDAVEKEYNGVMQGHGKRVSWMSECMGRKAGLKNTALIELAGIAILHDNSIIEYLDAVVGNEQYKSISAVGGHCAKGEERIRLLPFKTDIRNAVLYHHERADGRGPFRKTADETPLSAQIIHLADHVDTRFKLTQICPESFAKVAEYVHRGEGTLFGREVTDLFDLAFSEDVIREVEEKGIDQCLREDVPTEIENFSREEINGITKFFSDIIDFKSSFTRAHSMGVATKAEEMARYYGWDASKTDRYYFAGAMHDIGKMIITNDILEKPDKLTGEEFSKMQNHASATYRVLHQIVGMEDITEWAANHHEKLDGSGYPRRMKAEEQTFEDRLMACIDIYQALTEKRPYKDGLSHQKTMNMMRDMVAQGKIDGSIVEDLDKVYGRSGSGTSSAQQASEQAVKRWRCPTCGYVFEGETPPDRCPVCDMPGDGYEPLS
ncbi:MAG: HD domain-containing protein [Oscillospiraceae bacterium]|nr:HD domain-containing protein [Oscillospiraceae bacterium]